MARARAARGRRSRRARRPCSSTFDAVLLPGPTGAPFRIGAQDGHGALRALNAAIGQDPLLRPVQRDGPARGVGAGRLRRATGCRSPCSSPGARPTRRRCSPSPRRSSGPARGPTAAAAVSAPAGRRAAGDRRRGRARRGRGAARALRRRRRAARRDHQEHADRPRQRGRRGRRAGDPRDPRARAARTTAILGEEGGDVAGHERAALGRRPARRDGQLPVRHPAVVRQRRLRGARGGDLDPLRERAVRRSSRARARWLAGAPLRGLVARGPRRPRSSPPASATTRRCAPRQAEVVARRPPAGGRRAAAGQRGARPGVDRGRALRRLLRARHVGVGHRRRDDAVRRGRARGAHAAGRRRACRPACSPRRRGSPASCWRSCPSGAPAARRSAR